MHRRSSKKDENEIAFAGLEELLRRDEARGEAKSNGHAKNPAAVILGRLGGLKGGKVRAERLTADERRSIASKAAKTRWSKKAKKDKE